MSRIELVDPNLAEGRAGELLAAVKAKMGKAPNMTRAMATAPAVLDAYLKFSGALAEGQLPATVREQIALVVGEQNGCDYCLAAHSLLGKLAGLQPGEILDSRRGVSEDDRVQALLAFARRLVETRGRVEDHDFEQVRAAGYTDGEIAEVIGHVALNVFTNYFNIASETPVDFPRAAALEPASR